MPKKAPPPPPPAAAVIVMRPVSSLTPYAKNARTHNEAQVAAIAHSIQEFGFNNPVLVDSKGGVIAGHGRILAAHRLGLLEVPTLELSHMTDAQKRAYVIADNQLALQAGWDWELLKDELVALKDEGFGVDVIGFTDMEIANILAYDPNAPATHSAATGDSNEEDFWPVFAVKVPPDLKERIDDHMNNLGDTEPMWQRLELAIFGVPEPTT